eukprot:3218171-Amphidinium_carterae.1
MSDRRCDLHMKRTCHRYVVLRQCSRLRSCHRQGVITGKGAAVHTQAEPALYKSMYTSRGKH